MKALDAAVTLANHQHQLSVKCTTVAHSLYKANVCTLQSHNQTQTGSHTDYMFHQRFSNASTVSHLICCASQRCFQLKARRVLGGDITTANWITGHWEKNKTTWLPLNLTITYHFPLSHVTFHLNPGLHACIVFTPIPSVKKLGWSTFYFGVRGACCASAQLYVANAKAAKARLHVSPPPPEHGGQSGRGSSGEGCDLGG